MRLSKPETIELFIDLIEENLREEIKLTTDKVKSSQDMFMLKVIELDEWQKSIEKRLDKIEKHLFNKK